MIYLRAIMMLAAIVPISACSLPSQVARPSDIKLIDALKETADSLYAMREHTRDQDKVGLLVDEATVTFNVTAKSTNAFTAGADLSGLPAGDALGKLFVSNTLTNEGFRGNTITVKFKNIATATLSDYGKKIAKQCDKIKDGCDGLVLMRRNRPSG